MTETELEPEAPRRHPARDLLWTVPLAALLSLVPWVWASFARCGLFGCGRGWDEPGLRPVLGPCVVIGLLYGTAVVVVPWSRRRGLRALVSLAVGTVAAVGSATWILVQ